jgi:tetrahydromethanopterin S-methyltransferase subunit G
LAEDKVPVYISRELYEKAKKYVEEQGGFESVEELVEFVLGEVLSGEEGEQVFSEEEEEKVKERLRSLGYI